MGGGSWTRDAASTLRSTAKSAGYTDTFKHYADVTSGKVAAKVHETVDPSKLKGGIRESRDSADHPNTRPVAVCLDQTGSMYDIPKIVVDKVGGLLGAIIKNGALEHPSILFSAVGDAYTDDFPFQVGQFEADIRMEEQLSNFILEGRGGGNSHESYDLFLYFLARCTSTDAYEKRGEKGYAFLICDEPKSPGAIKSQIKSLFNQDIQDTIPFDDLVTMALEKWEIFILRPLNTQWGRDTNTQKQWETLFPDRVLQIQSAETICDTIAMLIAHEEGVDLDKVADTLVSEGSSLALVVKAKDEVTRTRGGKLVKVGTVSGDLDLGSGAAKRA